MTSRLIRSGQPDLLFNSIPGQSGVFQPPGPLHQVTQVAPHGKRAGPLVRFYHSAGRQPANSTPSGWGLVPTETNIPPPEANNNKSSNHPSVSSPVKSNVNKRTEKQAINKSPNKSSDRVLSDRLPKGSDDPIQQHYRFHSLDEDMEAENFPAESTNKQGSIIKMINKK